MFIITARVPRRRLAAGGITVLCCILAVAGAILLIWGSHAITASAEVSNIRGNDDRISYLTGLGWEISPDPSAAEELLVPKAFDESYGEYLALQNRQGFDLTKHCGHRIKRYTYKVLNYPDSSVDVQAALLVYKNRIVGGQLQAKDGSFILPLSGIN